MNIPSMSGNAQYYTGIAFVITLLFSLLVTNRKLRLGKEEQLAQNHKFQQVEELLFKTCCPYCTLPREVLRALTWGVR